MRAAYGQSTPPAILNVVSSGVRAATRAGWSIFVPIMLPVESYGVYSVFQTTVAAVTQGAVLGTPQTILREPHRELPMLGLFLHSLAIAAAVLVVLALTIARYDFAFQALVAAGAVATILYLQFAMRAKSRFQFGRVLRSEVLASAVFCAGILGIALVAWTGSRDAIDYRAMAAVEVLATAAIVVSLILGRNGRLTPAERSVSDTRRYLPSVYSVGILILFEVIIWRRLEVYFLQESPDGLQGVAVYGLATQLANIFLLFPMAMIEAWWPSFAKSFGASSRDYFDTISRKFPKYNLIYAVIVVGSICITPLLILTIFQKYAAWVWYVTGFVAIRVITSYSGFHSATLYASRRERCLYAPIGVAALVAIAANVVFTLRWGIRGAMVAFALTQVTVAAGTILASRRADARLKERA